MCRENESFGALETIRPETSLHVQRKLSKETKTIKIIRNISACAEKTVFINECVNQTQKHLCMCRENWELRIRREAPAETSLHVQRKRKVRAEETESVGNISACAEKTATSSVDDNPTHYISHSRYYHPSLSLSKIRGNPEIKPILLFNEPFLWIL